MGSNKRQMMYVLKVIRKGYYLDGKTWVVNPEMAKKFKSKEILRKQLKSVISKNESIVENYG